MQVVGSHPIRIRLVRVRISFLRRELLVLADGQVRDKVTSKNGGDSRELYFILVFPYAISTWSFRTLSRARRFNLGQAQSLSPQTTKTVVNKA